MSVQHSDLVSIHPFAHVAASDPGVVGVNKAWVDTSVTPYRLKIRNATNDGWLDVGIYSDSVEDLATTIASTGDVFQYKASGHWGTRTLAGLKSDLSLDNVPNIDATARANHTGTQTASTISNFNSQVDLRVASKFQTGYLAAQLNIVSSTTLTDTLLSATLEGGFRYAFEIFVVSFSLAGGVKYLISGTAPYSSLQNLAILRDTAGAVVTGTTAIFSVGLTNADNAARHLSVTGFIDVTTTGTVVLQAAQNSSSASATSIRAGSYMKFTKLN